MTLNEFKEAIKEETMRQQLAAFIADKAPENEEAEIMAVVEFAAGKGYEIAAEELSLDKIGAKELKDEELENVSGGSKPACMTDYLCYWVSEECMITAW